MQVGIAARARPRDAQEEGVEFVWRITDISPLIVVAVLLPWVGI